MSDTLTPSGLQSSAGLYGSCGVYQFDRNGAIFNPLDLNPYLLFDAESSMIGTLENPTLDLDPTKQESLDVITATRAGNATFVNLDGEIEIAQPNTVRVDNSLGYPAILIEPSATNLITYSEDFSHSSWTKTAATMEGGHTAPDGTATAYKLIEDNTDSVHRTFQTATASVSPSASISVFVKYSGRRYVLIRFADQSVGRWYDLISGTLGGTYLGTPNDSSIELIGNDWYRITLSHTSDAQARCEFWVSDTESVSSYTGDGTSGVYIWGAQLEAGSLTSYIPTSGSTVTRAADDLVISGSAFSSFYNASEGTFYVEAQSKESATYQPHYLEAHDASGQNRFAVYTQSVARVFVTANNSVQAHLSLGSYTANQLQRVAASYKVNDFVGSSNGSSEAGDASGLVPVNPTALAIGRRYADGYHIQGHIKRLIFWPYHSDSL
jgi:hypothetical protein